MTQDLCNCGKKKYDWQKKCWDCQREEEYQYEKESALKNEGTSSDKFVICPFCGCDNGTDERNKPEDIICDECKQTFHLDVEWSATYTTSKKEEK